TGRRPCPRQWRGRQVPGVAHGAKAGRRTVVVERRWIGGSCPNVNCLPSKNEVWSAKVATLVKHAAEFGMVTGSAAIEMVRVRERKRHMVDGLIAMHLERYKASGAELVMGTGRFVWRRRRWKCVRTTVERECSRETGCSST